MFKLKKIWFTQFESLRWYHRSLLQKKNSEIPNRLEVKKDFLLESDPWWQLLYCIFNKFTCLHYRKHTSKISNRLEIKLGYPRKYPLG